LKSLAIVCDKYDAAKAISGWSILWLQEWESKKCEDGFEGLLIVIYALDCAEAFTKMSRKAILDQVGPFDTNRIFDGFEMVPESLLADLEVRRRAVQSSLHKFLENLATPMLVTSCRHSSVIAHEYFRALKDSLLWPLSEMLEQASLRTIIERIGWVSEPNSLNQRHCACNVCGKRYKPSLDSARADHLSMIIGLCLPCIRGGTLIAPIKGNNSVCGAGH